MYPFHCRSIACAGINPRTLEDVCRMPLHKFRANCTCTAPALVVLAVSTFSLPFRFIFLVPRHLRPSLITVPPCRRSTRPLAGPRHCLKVDTSTSFPISPPFSSSTRAFRDHCALQRPIIPMQAEFKEVNSRANVFTPFYLNPRRFRMYCQFCIYTPACPPIPARPRAVHE